MERKSVSVGGEGEKPTESKWDVKNAYTLRERGCQRKAERERGERARGRFKQKRDTTYKNYGNAVM